MYLGRKERHRWGGHHLDDGGQAFWRLHRRRHQLVQDLGRGHEEEPASVDVRHLPQGEPEAGHRAVAPTSTAYRPEQVLVLVRVGMDHLPVGGDHVGTEQVVDGEAVGAAQIADATTQCQTGDTDGWGIPEAGHQPELRRGVRALTGGHAGLHRDGAGVHVHIDAFHGAGVEYVDPVAGGPRCRVMPAASDHERRALVGKDGYRAGHVADVRRSDQRQGTGVAADHHQFPGGVVLAGRRSDQGSPHLGLETLQDGGPVVLARHVCLLSLER